MGLEGVRRDGRVEGEPWVPQLARQPVCPNKQRGDAVPFPPPLFYPSPQFTFPPPTEVVLAGVGHRWDGHR